jgi:diguanylate cyclase (GGDEF)-like protein/PAS domain S-box-containing protein
VESGFPLGLDRVIFEHSMDAVLLTAPDGTIFRANPAACRLFNRTEEDICRLGRAGLVDPSSPKLQEFLETRASTGRVLSELIYIRGDGSRFLGEVSSEQFENESGELRTVLIIRDISERKQMEEMLRDAQRIAHLGSWYLDIASNQVIWSEELYRMFGLDPKLPPPPFTVHMELFIPESWEKLKAAVTHTLESGDPYEIELEIVRKDGSGGWMVARGERVNDSNGQPIGLSGVAQDISEQMSTLMALRSSEGWLRSILDNTNTCIASTDSQGRITSFNEAFLELLGYDAETLKQMNFADITHPEDLIHENVFFNEILEGKRTRYHINKRYIHKDGHLIWVNLSAGVIRNEKGKITNFVAVIQDISDKKAAEHEIAQLAFYDPLTGLPNRRLLQDRLKLALASSERSGRAGALLLIDLDNFKAINDTFGHDLGDLLLQQAGERVAACVRKTDTVARLGGDEFVVILVGLDEQEFEAASLAETICEKILFALGQPYRLAAYEYQGTASIGITLFNGNDASIEELMKQADIAMYQAKLGGRNTLRYFDRQMQESVAARVELEGELRRAIEKRQFQLHYQIQVDGSHRPIGAEALIRWHHSTLGQVPPSKFIPLAEETGLILPIGQWVLEAACAQVKAWEKNLETRDLVLAVNVSAKQFRQPEFVHSVAEIVERSHINPGKLKIELTEGALLENVEETVATMNTLSAIGLQFSLDDFGTGYSSLQYLKRLPLDELKIDQSFVRDIASDGNDKAIVHTIVAMALSLGLDVIAEGVETEEQRRLLLELGCTHYQGYMIGRPMAAEQFESVLADIAMQFGAQERTRTPTPFGGRT